MLPKKIVFVLLTSFKKKKKDLKLLSLLESCNMFIIA